jgi:hypothetical protein
VLTNCWPQQTVRFSSVLHVPPLTSCNGRRSRDCILVYFGAYRCSRDVCFCRASSSSADLCNNYPPFCVRDSISKLWTPRLLSYDNDVMSTTAYLCVCVCMCMCVMTLWLPICMLSIMCLSVVVSLPCTFNSFSSDYDFIVIIIVTGSTSFQSMLSWVRRSPSPQIPLDQEHSVLYEFSGCWSKFLCLMPFLTHVELSIVGLMFGEAPTHKAARASDCLFND